MGQSERPLISLGVTTFGCRLASRIIPETSRKMDFRKSSEELQAICLY